MGFFKKTWNWLTGKGFKEDEELIPAEQEKQEPTREERLRESLKEAEDITPVQRETEPEPRETQRTQQIKERPVKPVQKEKEVEKATQRYKESGSLKKVQEQLREGTINSIDFQPTNDISALNGIYNKLLQKSTISTIDKDGNEDQALIGVLIENRNKLQHRFTAEIRIITDGGEGFMSVDGILAEHMGGIGDFLSVGGTYTSQELQVAMQNALKYFEKQYGSIGGNIRPPMNKKVTIQDIQIRMTFA